MTARKTLVEAGVPLRRTSAQRLPSTARLQALRRQGWLLKEIGRRYGVTEAAVCIALKRADSLRTPS